MKQSSIINHQSSIQKGKVYLVGAGPGDPGLLTIKGKECLCEADVVIYDYLANNAFLEYAKDEAELIYVGKKAGSHTMSQARINGLIVDRASKGEIVVRLKGGDPFIFGRGGEEAQDLIKAGVDFEVVPGVTSAISVPAYAGIPLTHRDHASTVAFITGHEDPLKEKSDIAWNKLATGAGTLVFLMGVGNLPKIAEHLVGHGRSPDTPVAVIQRGTLAEQTTLVGNLENIARLAKENQIRPPAIIVVGDVVRLRKDLNWFETKPLFGKRIVVTRAREQASEFLRTLQVLGAEGIEFPTIEVMPPESWESLDRAIKALDEYDWLLFTSVNGVKFFLKRLEFLGKDIRDLKGIKIGVIGPKTAAIWHRMGIKPDLMPDEYRAEAVVESFEKLGITGAKILIPRAVKAREVLPEQLRQAGAHVNVVHAYRTISPDHDTGRLRELLMRGSIDMVTFTSSSTVSNFVKMFGADGNRLQKWMQNVAVACIGPITEKTAEENNFKVSLVPPKYTIESLAESIMLFFR
ncbi:MAG: uroporphyrinogen-III C-methyltransferase [Desulfobacteraceae bacterium]|nr:uroporphyrinogen-III C-methyltransferase [Desulfobacteraceae bacterium]